MMRALFLSPFAILLLGCDLDRSVGDDLRVQLVSPAAGAGTGSVHSPVAGRPTLRWHGSAQAQTFHVQIDDSCDAAAPCAFPSPEIDDATVASTSYVPGSSLALASTPPYVRRYDWRVQACKGDVCGEWSPPRYFVVGQDLALNRDVNGDGYSDFLVGAPESNAVASGGGQAFVYLGGPTLPPRLGLVISSDATRDWLGYAVAMAGDVNGDGIGDFLVRTVASQADSSTTGRVLLFFGGPKLKAEPDIVFPAGGLFSDRGSMAGCGDLNGDGYDDIAFAAVDRDANHQEIWPSRVEIHFGGPAMATSAPLVLYGESYSLATGTSILVSGDNFGASVSGAGDVNGDGYPDLVVGSDQTPDSAVGGGKARIYFGGPQMDATPDVILANPNQAIAAGQFGWSVAGVGDVNGDGYADVAVGSVDWGPLSSSPGSVYVYLGGPAPGTTPAYSFAGIGIPRHFGQVIVAAGDVNHDGFADFAVNSQGIPPDQVSDYYGTSLTPGQVFLYFGANPGPSPIFTRTMDMAFPDNRGVALLDLDGDGEAELITTQMDNVVRVDAELGRVSIYRGDSFYAGSPVVIPDPISGGGYFGFSLSR